MEHCPLFEISRYIRYYDVMTKTIKPICAFKDNYIWLLMDSTRHTAWVVDPGDASPVTSALKEANLTLEGILITHHHHDHTSGVLTLLNKWKNIRVVASHLSHLTYVTERVSENTKVTCGTFTFNVLEIPGHTRDHIAFYDKQHLFCGDTLFSAGCGKAFEGTSNQLYQSLCKLQKLLKKTRVYCGHEYTLANLQFAQLVEPNNKAIKKKIEQVQLLRLENLSTLPSSLGDELKFNPFLRCDQPDVIRAAEQYAGQSLTHPAAVFTQLRAWKNAR